MKLVSINRICIYKIDWKGRHLVLQLICCFQTPCLISEGLCLSPSSAFQFQLPADAVTGRQQVMA